MINLIFIRHGATQGNLEKRYIGTTDEPLSDIGIKQCHILKEKNIDVDLVFVSPMIRAVQSAEIIFPDRVYKIIDDFKEINFGLFEGKTADELSSDEKYIEWVDSYCQSSIPCGESICDFKKRCCNGFERIINTIPDGHTAAFVVHGGVIMSVFEKFEKSKKGFYDYHISNGSAIVCEYDDNMICLKSFINEKTQAFDMHLKSV